MNAPFKVRLTINAEKDLLGLRNLTERLNKHLHKYFA